MGIGEKFVVIVKNDVFLFVIKTNYNLEMKDIKYMLSKAGEEIKTDKEDSDSSTEIEEGKYRVDHNDTLS